MHVLSAPRFVESFPLNDGFFVKKEEIAMDSTTTHSHSTQAEHRQCFKEFKNKQKCTPKELKR